MLIGREKEIDILSSCYDSDKSEFVAIYGRRRIGKTFLIKELFETKFLFYTSGILNGSKDAQLEAWNNDMSRFGGTDLNSSVSWIQAFESLNLLLERSSAGKKVIFLDEVPWMATMHSDFLAGLDYFWNRFASSRGDVMLIICGSAASWIVDKVVNDTGGLHNRLTRQISLKPFNLCECEQYFESRNVPMTRFQIAEAYMIFGGIPYYLSLMDSRYSLYQNVDKMYFESDAELSNEFGNLYRSLYKNAENYIQIIEVLAKKGIGLSRQDISDSTELANSGRLTKMLSDLVISGFIRKYKAFGQKKRDSLYQLVDFFSLFDIRFRKMRDEHNVDFWLNFSSTTAHSIWRGISYEKLCLLHLSQIRKKLGISGVLTSAYSWRGKSEDSGAQIDLVIDRNDNIVNLCEIKHSSGLYLIDKKYHESMRNKRTAFIHNTNTRKSVLTTMITTYGLKRNAYSAEILSEVILDDLFCE